MKYALLSYGITALPLDVYGHVLDDEFHHDVTKQRQREKEIQHIRSSSSSTIIEYPNHLDVLLGRGKPYQDFPGNIRLNQLVERQRLTYENLNKGEKSVCIMEIVHTIHLMGGRFLQKSKQGRQRQQRIVSSSSSSSDKTKQQHTLEDGMIKPPPVLGSSSDDEDDDDDMNLVPTRKTFPPSSSSSTILYPCWEEADHATVHKKVNNCFQTRKRLQLR